MAVWLLIELQIAGITFSERACCIVPFIPNSVYDAGPYSALLWSGDLIWWLAPFRLTIIVGVGSLTAVWRMRRGVWYCIYSELTMSSQASVILPYKSLIFHMSFTLQGSWIVQIQVWNLEIPSWKAQTRWQRLIQLKKVQGSKTMTLTLEVKVKLFMSHVQTCGELMAKKSHVTLNKDSGLKRTFTTFGRKIVLMWSSVDLISGRKKEKAEIS